GRDRRWTISCSEADLESECLRIQRTKAWENHGVLIRPSPRDAIQDVQLGDVNEMTSSAPQPQVMGFPVIIPMTSSYV
ncbi:hypothetical protein ACOMHN_055018, partial [Nucella lapillus]